LKEAPAPKPKPGERAVALRHFAVEVDGKRLDVKLREQLDEVVRPKKPRPPKKSGGIGGGGGEALTAPMQGTIVKVLVEQGQSVEAGATIAVLEAMKMENSILAHTSGKVEEIKVKPGQSVEAGAVLALIR
ncbi:MAG: acetyl-CoA/propionyl-CoA carboxylase, biotin carboxylase, biotin carboxyl carrier protein, partial [Actinomycetota bacterium]|nr:acetyl-CoA/propionyl-CoA carboxylase, biotin carboxylase, biotin carboxyl carrier protein [Actinomycetota bacterium]